MTDLKDLSEEKRGKLVKNLKEEIENEKKMHMLLEQKVSEITEKKEKLKFSQKIYYTFRLVFGILDNFKCTFFNEKNI